MFARTVSPSASAAAPALFIAIASYSLASRLKLPFARPDPFQVELCSKRPAALVAQEEPLFAGPWVHNPSFRHFCWAIAIANGEMEKLSRKRRSSRRLQFEAPRAYVRVSMRTTGPAAAIYKLIIISLASAGMQI